MKKDVKKDIQKDIGEIVTIFLYYKNNIKIYHWQTKSYSRHKASDELEQSLSDKIDKFIETIQGSRNSRLSVNNKINIKNQTDSSIVTLLKEFNNWLTFDLPKLLFENETELYNQRDEIKAEIDKTLYLFTLS
jgi:hypothetical protein